MKIELMVACLLLLLSPMVSPVRAADPAAAKKGDRQKSAAQRRMDRLSASKLKTPAATAERLTRTLKLDAAQEKQMKTLLMAYRKEQVKKESGIRYAHLELLEILYPASPDADKVAAKVKEWSALKTDLRSDEIRKMRDARKFLNDEQFERFKGLILDGLFQD